METVLISFIGTGDLQNQEYKDTDYYFEGETSPRKTAVFGSALLDYLQSRNEKVERWLIMGTAQSIWSELIKMTPDLNLTPDEKKLKEFLWEESFYCASDDDHISQISQEKLNEWERVLAKKRANTIIRCRLVGDATDSDSHNLIFQSLLDVIQNDNKVVFDVTHGLRNQPIITSFALMYLRWLRNVKNVELYYGALELKGEVVKLDFCGEILEATEAVAIVEQTGNFQRIGEQLAFSENFQQNLSTLTFSDEMLRLKPGVAQKVKNELKNQEAALRDEPLKSSLASKLKESLEWSDENSYARRLRGKAVKEFEHKQYFKAIATLWEAVLIAGCHKFSIPNPNDTDSRKDAENRLYDYFRGKNDFDDLKNLEHLRNAVLHGSDSDNRTVQRAVENVAGFKQIFEKGVKLVDEILK